MKYVALRSLKEGQKFIAAGKEYRVTTFAADKSDELWAENLETGDEKKFIHLNRPVEIKE